MQQYTRIAVVMLLVMLIVSGACSGTKGGKGNEVKLTAPPMLSGALGETVIFFEGFNDSVPPAGWKIINRDGEATDDYWYISSNIGPTATPIAPFEGAAFAADYYGSANGFYIDDYLITPNTGGSAPSGAVDSLVFWLASRLSTTGDYPDSLEIRVSTTGSDTGNFTTKLDYVLAPKGVWTRFAYKLPLGIIRYIAFRYLIYDGGVSGANSDKIGLDAVQIIRYTPTAVGEENGLLPGAFALNQNYPNPFNPSTQIEFALPKSSYARLAVYDALGREVATLVDGELSAGVHERNFDAAGLAGGVYFYRLSAGTFNETRRMLLVK